MLLLIIDLIFETVTIFVWQYGEIVGLNSIDCIDCIGLDEMIKNTYCSANFFDKIILMMIWKLSVNLLLH